MLVYLYTNYEPTTRELSSADASFGFNYGVLYLNNESHTTYYILWVVSSDVKVVMILKITPAETHIMDNEFYDVEEFVSN